MAMRLRQLPLPWLPEGAALIAPGIGVVLDPDGGGTTWVHGMATFSWLLGTGRVASWPRGSWPS
jgi:hypothetical protein